MARVNHKLVKQRLNEKRSKITDRQFFTSRILAGHFEDIAAAQTKRYNYRRLVHVELFWKPKDPSIAQTNNQVIQINCGNPLVTHIRGRENRYQIVCGLFAHELGHVLYTDFLAGQTYQNWFQMYRWYPEPPTCKNSQEEKNESELWAYAKAEPRNMQLLQYLAHYIGNILEDGYIENRMLTNFPGTLGYGLENLRREHFQQIPTVTQLIETEDCNGKHIFESILQLMLSYAKFGEIKYGDEPLNDERIQTIFALLSEIDSAVLNSSAKNRWNIVNTIMVRCWEYIGEFLEMCKIHMDEASASGQPAEAAQTLSEILQAMAGGSKTAEGNTTAVSSAENEPSGESASRNAAQEKTKEDAADSAGDQDDCQSGSQTETENEENQNESEDAGDDGSETESAEDVSVIVSGNKNGSEKQKVSEAEKGRIPQMQTSSVSEPHGGSITVNNEYKREKYDNAAKDIDHLLEKMAEKAACKELENERMRELNETAQNISYGDIHSGVNIQISRIDEVDTELVEQYESIAPPLLAISRQMQKGLIHQLEDRRRGGKQTGLMYGRRLDTHALCRNDGKIFYKSALPNEMPEIAVGFLCDESGSMASCQRTTYARATAIIMYDFCQGLDIPITIYGHTTSYEGVDLFSYAEFESFDRDDKYRLMDISARGSNRDGAALRFVAEHLLKRPEEIKILFLVSDGQPADAGYYGTAAEEDLRGIKHEYERKGIILVSAAIGDDKENIERIYGDSFLDITDLNQLPVKLISVIKRHIRV